MPIIPTNLASIFCFDKTSYNNLKNLPLVPVIVTNYFYKMNKKYLNLYRLSFFFKNLDNLQLSISIPGLSIIASNSETKNSLKLINFF